MINRSGFMPFLKHLIRRQPEHRRRVSTLISHLPCRRHGMVPYTDERGQESHQKEAHTGLFNPFRRKNALQLSHEIAWKLHPSAADPQTTQVNDPSLFLLELFGNI